MWTVLPAAPAPTTRPGPTSTRTWGLQCLPGGPSVWNGVWGPGKVAEPTQPHPRGVWQAES